MLLVAAALCVISRQDGGLSKRPELTLSAPNNLAGSAVFVDREDRRLVSVSSEGDRAVRIWALPIRGGPVLMLPPSDPSGAGHLGPAAMSADGKTLVIGTNTPADWNNGYAVYVFDLDTREMKRSISGFDRPITAIALDARGQRLAMALGSELRQYKLGKQVDLISSDGSWSGTIHDLALGTGGLCVAASDSGVIKSYQADGTELATGTSKIGGLHVVRISPDASLAVFSGSYAQAGLELRNAKDLRLVHLLDASGVKQGSFDIPCFSKDGQTIAAMFGAIDEDGRLIVRAWSTGTGAKLADTPLDRRGGASITALASGFAVGLSDGSIWDVRPTSGAKPLIPSARADFVNIDGGYKGLAGEVGPHAASDARLATIALPIRDPGRTWLAFNASARKVELLPIAPPLRTGPLQLPGIHIEPRMTHGSLWGMALNGVPMEQPAGNVTYCHTLLQNPTRIATGSLWNVQVYDQFGKRLWTRTASREVRQIVGSADGTALATVSADGIIVWRRASDGEPYLSGFVDPRTLDWVLWTPSGYFDCSPRAENWLRWRVNRGPEVCADLLRLASFRARLCRPDIIDQVLTLHDEAAAVAAADRLIELPSNVEPPSSLAPLSPRISVTMASTIWSDRKWSVQAEIAVEPGLDTEFTSIELLSGGVSLSRAPYSGADQKVSLTGTAGRAVETVRAIVRTRSRTYESDSIPVLRVPRVGGIKVGGFGVGEQIGSTPRQADSGAPDSGPVSGPRTLHVIAVGIDQYLPESKLPSLRAAVNDAKAFATAIRDHLPPSFEKCNLVLLLGEEATFARFDKAITSLKPAPGDIVAVYFAGHGLDYKGQFVLPLFGYNPTDPLHTSLDAFALARYAWPLSQCARWLVVDACHSGAFASKFVQAVGNDSTGFAVFASCQASELAREDVSNGYFTKALVEGLNGSAAIPGTARVSIGSLQAYIDDRFQQPPLNGLGQQPRIAISELGRIYVSQKR